MYKLRNENNRFSQEIVEYLSRLNEKIKIDAIILFGSHAKGTAYKYSDYDFFIISSDWPDNYRERINIFWENIPNWVEIIAWKPEEVKKFIYRPFILQILTEGIVIYGEGEKYKKAAQEYIKTNNLKKTKFGFVREI